MINTQKNVSKNWKYEIPVIKFEEDINTESSKDKKNEILDLFTNHNQLKSEDEFNEIESQLHFACREGDLDLIKILLNEKIKDNTISIPSSFFSSIFFKIDEINNTASLFRVNGEYENFIIPRTIRYKLKSYLVTSITGIRSTNNNSILYIKCIKFEEGSAVTTIYNDAFYHLSVNEIHFPKSLIELKDGWCNYTHNLAKITISPSSGQFMLEDGKYLLGKSDRDNDEFDILLFAPRDIKEISIPSNVTKINIGAVCSCHKLRKVEIPTNSNLKIIGNNAFSAANIDELFIPASVTKIGQNAFKLCYIRKIVIQQNSNLQIIGKSAFSNTKIEEISIPPSVTKICDRAFFQCEGLKKVEITKNSNLQIIGECAFYSSKINEIYIPTNVTKICDEAFRLCSKLKKVEIPTNSNLQTIGKNAFYSALIEEIYFPESLIELKDGWCTNARELTKITISPSNGQFLLKDDKYLLGKSDRNNDEFDILLFAARDIKEISIQSNITKICGGAFSSCKKLRKVEIPTNSNLQTIEYCAFEYSSIHQIYIPPTVTKIFNNAFYNCKHLRKVDIPTNSNLQIIENSAFSGSGITQLSIPPSVTNIGKQAFWYCSELLIIEINEGSKLNSIQKSLFADCSKLILMISSSLKNIIKRETY